MATTRKSDLQAKTASESDGKRILPSDIEMAAIEYGLTSAEADTLVRSGKVSQAEADKLKSARTVYRVRYEAVEPTEVDNPVLAAQAKADEERARLLAEANPSGADPAKPESGPYGPNADYQKVELPADKDAV